MSNLNLQQINDLENDIHKAFELLKINNEQTRLEEFKKKSQQPNFWNDNTKAQNIVRQISMVENKIGPWLDAKKNIEELKELFNLKDHSLQEEIVHNFNRQKKKIDFLKKQLLFSGPYDEKDVILQITAGAGGTDAQDWTQILARMYNRWAQKDKLKVKTLEQTFGEEAGLKSIIFEITDGINLYGKLKGEAGVHRLVRLSPFNANNLRQTSFAKVEVLPIIDNQEDITIDDKDLKIEVFRSSGRGGQSVNTTDSAVRITHLPTSITVSIQNERSQLQNKETAINILKSKLKKMQLEQHQKEINQLKGPNTSAEWGNQIRNYVLHPYKLVKDTRSGYETSNVQDVLDGNIENFIEELAKTNPPQ